MSIKASTIVRSYAVLKGMQNPQIFNDRTTFGRSIKVWGQPKEFYEKVALFLNVQGYKTKVVKTPRLRGFYRHGEQYRIWVYGK